MNANLVKSIHAQANKFAEERINQETDAVFNTVDIVESALSTPNLKKELGRMLATAYAKGYADCYEASSRKKIIL